MGLICRVRVMPPNENKISHRANYKWRS